MSVSRYAVRETSIEAPFDKIDILFTPPFSMDANIEPIWRPQECSVFQRLENWIPTDTGMFVREGVIRFKSVAATASTAISALYRSTYIDATRYIYAHVGTTIKRNTVVADNAAWIQLTAYHSEIASGGNLSLTTTGGVFRQFKDKTFYSNYDNPVLLIEKGTANTCLANKAGIPDPCASRYISYCEIASYWTTTGGTLVEDFHPARFTQGDCGLSLSKGTSGAATATFDLGAAHLDLTTFTDGTTCSTDDYIAIDVFRFWKDSIDQLTIRLISDATNHTTLTNYYSANIYIKPVIQIVGLSALWSFSPRQDTICADWANNPLDSQMFFVRIKKKWFESHGSPAGWNTITGIQISILPSTLVSTTQPAKVTFDNIRALKAHPDAAPLMKQVATCERNEGWSFPTGTGGWVDFFATKGFSSIRLAAGAIAELDGISLDLTTYGTGTAIGPADGFVFDVGGVGSSSSYVTVTLCNGAKTAVFLFGFVSALRGGGVERVKTMPTFDDSHHATDTYKWTITADFDWSDVDKLIIANWGVGEIYIDNIRVQPIPVWKLIDKMMPVDLVALDALDDFLDKYRDEFPVITSVITAAGDFYSEFMYNTFGDGTLTYPDYTHKQWGIAGMSMQISAGASFGVRIRFKVEKDLAHYYLFELSSAYSMDWATDNYGWIHKHNISIQDHDEFQIWASSPNWAAIRRITVRFYCSTHPVASYIAGTIEQDDYWEYIIDYSQIQQKLQDAKTLQEMWDDYKKLEDKDDLKSEQTKRFYEDLAKSMGQDTEHTVALGEDEKSAGWVNGFLRWTRSEMLQSESAGVNASWEHISAYEIMVEAGGGDAEIAFDNFVLRKKGALKGNYYYKLVLEDKEGRQSVPSEPTRKVIADGCDALISNLYVPNAAETRITNKVLLRLGGTRQIWGKVADLDPSTLTHKDGLVDEKVFPWIEEYYYPPPKAKVMEVVGNSMWYLNTVDRWNKVRPSRGYKSRPYCAYQVADEEGFDLRPEDGQEITACCYYNTYFVVAKSHSIWTVDENLIEAPICRTEDFGVIARRSLVATNYGLIFLSHRGIILGDMNQWDSKFGEPVQSLLSPTTTQLAKAVGFYKNDYYYLFYGTTANTMGVGCYLPKKQWFKLSGITVEAIQLLEGIAESNTVIVGDADGFVNTIFSGNTDVTIVNGTDTPAAIGSYITTMDHLPTKISISKYLRRLFIHYKAITTSPTVIVTPVTNQSSHTPTSPIVIPTTAYDIQSFDFEQGLEGHTLGVALTFAGRLRITDLQLELWQRSERR